jgi:bifunctional non-homologous end joining protein LigD
MAKRAEVEFEGVRLTSPEKVLYSRQGITKRGLAEYYAAVADWILPEIRRRPLSLVRCPAGSGRACFFQKHVGSGVPAEVHAVDIPDGAGTTDKGEGRADYLWIDDLSGLVALCQMGVLEIHPWGSTIDALETPDRLVFDLDPSPDVPWERVVATAKDMRRRLAKIGLESFLKTTGGKGVHVVVPVVPEHDWSVVKPWSRSFVEAMVADAPEAYTLNMLKKERVGKIFLDYLRNSRGATAVAAYSTRSRASATVATPLRWEELTAKLDLQRFTIESVPKRLAKLADDPWKEMARRRQKLPA